MQPRRSGARRRVFPRPHGDEVSYFDAAYIAMFYVDEPESDAVRRLAEKLVRVHCCALGRIEVAGVFYRKRREGAFSEREFREVSAQFTDALHLACAREHGLRRVYTSDRHMLRAAPAFGVEAMGI